MLGFLAMDIGFQRGEATADLIHQLGIFPALDVLPDGFGESWWDKLSWLWDSQDPRFNDFPVSASTRICSDLSDAPTCATLRLAVSVRFIAPRFSSPVRVLVPPARGRAAGSKEIDGTLREHGLHLELASKCSHIALKRREVEIALMFDAGHVRLGNGKFTGDFLLRHRA